MMWGGANMGICLLFQEVILRCRWVESAGPRGSELGLLTGPACFESPEQSGAALEMPSLTRFTVSSGMETE